MGLQSLAAAKLLPFLKFGIIPATSWLWIRFGPKPGRVANWALWFVAVTSTLFLLLSIPTGSVDISDPWLFLGFSAVPALLIIAVRQSLLAISARLRSTRRLAGTWRSSGRSSVVPWTRT
jgi:hypothetical protein